MKPFQSKSRPVRLSILAVFLLLLGAISHSIAQEGKAREFAGVGLTGVQHIGPDFNISSFYVDGYYGSNVGREGGGGRTVCCVLLPKKWRPDLTVEVRWVVGDWSKENLAETAVGNYRSLTAEGVYKANVPVEKYDVPEQVYVHFFAGGKVRVVSNIADSESAKHQVRRNDPHAADTATKGTRVKDLFTKEELAEMDRKTNEHEKNMETGDDSVESADDTARFSLSRISLMKLFQSKSRFILAVFLLLLGAISHSIAQETKATEFAGVGLTGVQHIGPDFNISSFYVDGYYGSNVGREGGGGRTVCCVMLPKKWRPDLTVEVRWVVGDWSKENLEQTAVGNYRSLTLEGVYKAIVPVEKYDVPHHVYVHFFAGGKVRVVSNTYGSASTKHPILRGDPRAADTATPGTRVKDLFTKEELAEMDRRTKEHEKKYGDWR